MAAPPSHHHYLLKVGSSNSKEAVTFDARPETIGPGWWTSLHVMAQVLDTTKLISKSQAKLVFEEQLSRGVGQYFPCLHCRIHALEYITKNKPSSSTSSSSSLLEWTYIFHQAVNARLKKKKTPSFEDLKTFLEDLKDGKGCTQCGGGGDNEKQELPLLLKRPLID